MSIRFRFYNNTKVTQLLENKTMFAVFINLHG